MTDASNPSEDLSGEMPAEEGRQNFREPLHDSFDMTHGESFASDDATDGYTPPLFINQEFPDGDHGDEGEGESERSEGGFDTSDTAAVNALNRLVLHSRALEQLGPVTSDRVKDALQAQIDESVTELSRILLDRLADDEIDARDLFDKISKAYHDPDASSQERSTWVAAVILAGVAMVAATGAAPLGALAVGDVVWKETVKAAVTGLLTGLATVAADRTLQQRQAAKNRPSAPAPDPATPDGRPAKSQEPEGKRQRFRLGEQTTALPRNFDDERPGTGAPNPLAGISAEVAEDRPPRIAPDQVTKGRVDAAELSPDETDVRGSTPPGL